MKFQHISIYFLFLAVLLVLVACSGGVQPPAIDPQVQVATIVAATQAALQAAPPTAVAQWPEQLTPTVPPVDNTPQAIVVQLAPDLQNLLTLPQSRLQLLALNELTGEKVEVLTEGGASTSQFTLMLTPGSYRVIAVYSPIEGVDILGAWAADGNPQLIEVGVGPVPQPVWLSRPAEACSAPVLALAERVEQGEAYAMVKNCPTGQLLVSFDESVANPPSAAIYAEGIGMFSAYVIQDVASAARGTVFTLQVPPGVYHVSARSTVADDLGFYGAWGQRGLAEIQVGHRESKPVFLAKPGDACLDVYQLDATPDGRFPETRAYAGKLDCGQTTSGVGETIGLDTLGDPDGVFNFKSASGWYEFEDSQYQFEVKDGQMVMQAKKSELNDTWGTNALKLKDFYLDGVFRVGPDCSDKDRYGLLVRAPDPGHGYVFSVNCGGQFRLYYMMDGKYHAVQEWKASSEIDTGANAVNTLGVWMKGSQIRLYVNGKLLGEYTDTTFDEGIIGLHIGAVQTSDLVVRVDEVRYWDLK